MEEIDAVSIERNPMKNNLKHEQGPFDIIGDIHGCFDELCLLLAKLGYHIQKSEGERFVSIPPSGRKVIFLGDLCDRGPKTPEVLQLVMDMVESGVAFCIPGNHDNKLCKKLQGANVKIAHGMAESLEQLKHKDRQFVDRLIPFLDGLISHYVLDDGKLVVAHAGLKEEFHGRGSGKVRAFAVYGDVTGEVDEKGKPMRLPWYNDYRGKAMVVYGHTAILEPEWINNTLCIDTGCVFGGKLTALQYPEKRIISVEALKTYTEPDDPLANLRNPETPEKRCENFLDILDVIGKKIINCRRFHHLTLREENIPAALEMMSRFGIDPKWMIYLPPTMSLQKPALWKIISIILQKPLIIIKKKVFQR